MPSYELAHEAEDDLRDIARYTFDTWGTALAEHYATSLESHFQTLVEHPEKGRIFLDHRPELRVSHCKHHLIFHLIREQNCPLILAVFHERMDLMERLRHRLDG